MLTRVIENLILVPAARQASSADAGAIERHPARRDATPILSVVQDAPPAVLIGAVLGDSDVASMNWSRTIGALSQRLARLLTGLATPVRLNVIFVNALGRRASFAPIE